MTFCQNNLFDKNTIKIAIQSKNTDIDWSRWFDKPASKDKS